MGMRIKSEGFRELPLSLWDKRGYREIYGVSLLPWGSSKVSKELIFFKYSKRDISLDDINILAKRFAKIIEKNVLIEKI